MKHILFALSLLLVAVGCSKQEASSSNQGSSAQQCDSICNANSLHNETGPYAYILQKKDEACYGLGAGVYFYVDSLTFTEFIEQPVSDWVELEADMHSFGYTLVDSVYCE